MQYDGIHELITRIISCYTTQNQRGLQNNKPSLAMSCRTSLRAIAPITATRHAQYINENTMIGYHWPSAAFDSNTIAAFVGKSTHIIVGDHTGQSVPDFSVLNVSAVTITAGSVPDDMFKDCVGLYRLILRDEVTAIGARAFQRCTVLHQVQLPATVSTLGANAFDGCVALRSATFRGPGALVALPSHAFFNCVELRSVTLPL